MIYPDTQEAMQEKLLCILYRNKSTILKVLYMGVHLLEAVASH